MGTLTRARFGGRTLAGLVLAALALAGCGNRPPSPEKLQALGPIAVVAELAQQGPVSRLGEDERARMLLGVSTTAPEAVNERLEKALVRIESPLETEARFRGEFIDRLGNPPPFAVAGPEVMFAAGNLLAREDSGTDYRALARAGVQGVIELRVRKLELVPADGSRPAGLHVDVAARFLELPAGDVTWRSRVEFVPEEGSTLAIDLEALRSDPETVYRAAVASAAQAVGDKLARALLRLPEAPAAP